GERAAVLEGPRVVGVAGGLFAGGKPAGVVAVVLRYAPPNLLERPPILLIARHEVKFGEGLNTGQAFPTRLRTLVKRLAGQRRAHVIARRRRFPGAFNLPRHLQITRLARRLVQEAEDV